MTVLTVPKSVLPKLNADFQNIFSQSLFTVGERKLLESEVSDAGGEDDAGE